VANHLIIAVGGTGQRLLHFYSQIYLLGQAQEPFRAFVLDTDQLMPSLEKLRNFFDLVREARLSPGKIPHIETLPVQLAGANTVHQLLTGEIPQARGVIEHPAQVFFSADTLRQETGYGLYARPALSAVIAAEDTIAKFGEQIELPDDTFIVVVGSIIGGTGGGLIVPLLSRLQSVAASGRNISVRAVLYGNYFRPTPGRMDRGSTRFISNVKMVGETLGQTASGLHSYTFISSPIIDALQNIDSNCLDWPETKENVFWKGCVGVHHLLRETVQTTLPEFFEREVNIETYLNNGRLSFNASQQARDDRLSCVKSLDEEKVFQRMAIELVPGIVWGSGLPKYVVGFWKRARGSRMYGDVSDFPERIQRRVVDTWRTLSTVFPDIITRKATVNDIRRAANGWLLNENDLSPRAFSNIEHAAKITAANILFATLRGNAA